MGVTLSIQARAGYRVVRLGSVAGRQVPLTLAFPIAVAGGSAGRGSEGVVQAATPSSHLESPHWGRSSIDPELSRSSIRLAGPFGSLKKASSPLTGLLMVLAREPVTLSQVAPPSLRRGMITAARRSAAGVRSFVDERIMLSS